MDDMVVGVELWGVEFPELDLLLLRERRAVTASRCSCSATTGLRMKRERVWRSIDITMNSCNYRQRSRIGAGYDTYLGELE